MNDMPQWSMHSVAALPDSKIHTVRVVMPDLNLFPHVVSHPWNIFTPEWSHMHAWLRANVGEYKTHWYWISSDQIRFGSQEHATAFAVAWS